MRCLRLQSTPRPTLANLQDYTHFYISNLGLGIQPLGFILQAGPIIFLDPNLAYYIKSKQLKLFKIFLLMFQI